MTLKVQKSQIAGVDFAAEVAAHVAALAAHDAHMGNVRAEADKPADQKVYEAFPAPAARPLVEQAISRTTNDRGGTTFAADYHVEDDGPTPAEVFEAKRSALRAAVADAETAARNAVVPPGKVRLHTIRYRDAFTKDKADRTAEDKKTIANYEALGRRLDAVDRHGATLHSEIEDLTPATVDGWKLREFPA